MDKINDLRVWLIEEGGSSTNVKEWIFLKRFNFLNELVVFLNQLFHHLCLSRAEPQFINALKCCLLLLDDQLHLADLFFILEDSLLQEISLLLYFLEPDLEVVDTVLLFLKRFYLLSKAKLILLL